MHVELAQANDFVAKEHRHHKPVQGHRFSIGATRDGELVGVAIVGRPVGGTHQQDWVEVTRLCTDGTFNACSFLYGAAARAAKALGYKRIQTYILASESGVSLKSSGWTFDRLSHPVGWHHDGPRAARNVASHLSERKQLWMKILEEPVAAPAEIRPRKADMQRFEVREQVLMCTSCGLHELCKAPVPFYGPTPNYLAIVGEAPGKVEDEAGQPFVGPAGELLRDCLKEAGIDPEQVFWCNAASCWPHRENHTPTSAEINACSSNLAAQLQLADPSWVVLLGGVALSTLRSDLKITRTRGHVLVSDRRHYFVTFHPSYALRNARGEQFLRRDLQALAFMLGAEDWSSAADDSCVGCGTDPEQIGEHDLHLRFDEMGAPYCSECWRTASPVGKAQVKEERAIGRTQERTGKLFA